MATRTRKAYKSQPTATTSIEIVERYLTYFRDRGHSEIAGSPLTIPGNSTSFVIAGMQPLLPYLRGLQPPPAARLVGWQRCLRTDDIEMVGRNGRKLTSFHMLGNWSIGDYGKREAIAYALDLLDRLGVARGTLWVTTFAGDGERGLPPDDEAVDEWRRAGIAPERIVPLGSDDNLWPAGGGGLGICGPCTEMFVDRGAALGCGLPTCQPGCACERFLEIWNLVFLQYAEEPDGYRPLPLLSVDTGMGLERVAAVLQDVATVFDTDLFASALARLAELAPVGVAGGGEVERRARHIIVDHVRAALFAALAGVVPDRDGRGSVVRRLIRRAARQGRMLGLTEPFLEELAEPLLAAHAFLLPPDVSERVPALRAMLRDEERQFARVLGMGLRRLARLRPDEQGRIAGEAVFALFADRGFPPDLAGEILAERGLSVDWPGYERALEQHRTVSRVGTERHFGAGAAQAHADAETAHGQDSV